jgi:hypothetical protein
MRTREPKTRVVTPVSIDNWTAPWQNFDALVFFNRIMDLFFKLLVFFVVIVVGMGLVRLFWETWRIMAASETARSFQLHGQQPVNVFHYPGAV